jgi:hypothetical protein
LYFLHSYGTGQSSERLGSGGIEPVTDTSEQDRYLALARDAFAIADRMKDPQARTIMRGIGNGYLAMARSAEKRETTAPGAQRKASEG